MKKETWREYTITCSLIKIRILCHLKESGFFFNTRICRIYNDRHCWLVNSIIIETGNKLEACNVVANDVRTQDLHFIQSDIAYIWPWLNHSPWRDCSINKTSIFIIFFKHMAQNFKSTFHWTRMLILII